MNKEEMKGLNYEAPAVETIQVAVEQGFVSSSPTTADNLPSNWWEE